MNIIFYVRSQEIDRWFYGVPLCTVFVYANRSHSKFTSISTDLLFFISLVSDGFFGVPAKTSVEHMVLRQKPDRITANGDLSKQNNNKKELIINFQSDFMKSHMRRLCACCIRCVSHTRLRSSWSAATSDWGHTNARVSISQSNLHELNFNSSSSFLIFSFNPMVFNPVRSAFTLKCRKDKLASVRFVRTHLVTKCISHITYSFTATISLRCWLE